MDKIKLLIADDHPVVREGLKTMLQSADEFEVIGQAANGEEAISLTEELKPDVVILDMRMPKIEGIEATCEIKKRVPSAEVVILSTHDQDEYIYRSLQAGAKGYVIKDSGLDELLEVVRAAARGESLLSSNIATKLVDHLSTPQPQRSLTDREQTVLNQLAKGLRNREIAQNLNITERTVKNHVTNIINKLGVTNRTEALAHALRKGLIELD